MSGPGVKDRAEGERLATREVFRGRTIRLDVDRVRLPNGREMDFEMIHHPGAAAVVPVLASGEVLMVRQYRYATGGWLLEVPAGKLDPGETPETCARREVEEEVGHRAGELVELGWIWTTPGFTDEKIWIYLATGLEETRQGLQDDEVLTVEKVPLEEAVGMAARGEIVDCKSTVGLLRAAARLGISLEKSSR